MTNVSSTGLAMADGRVVVREGDELRCTTLGGERCWTAAVAGARDHAIAGGTVCVVTAGELACVDLATGERWQTAAIPSAPTTAVCGDGWLASVAARTLELVALPACELALAVDRSRVVLARAGTLELRRGDHTVWTARIGDRGDRAIAGSILLEGRVAAVCLEVRATLRIVVVDLRDGALLHSLAVAGARQIAFAPRRGWALVRHGDRELTTIDLRIGRIVAHHTHSEPVVAIAVDAAFEHVALQLGDPPHLAVVDAGLLPEHRDDLAAPEVECVELEAPVIAVREPDEAEPEPVACTVDTAVALLALGERDGVVAASADEAAVDLQARLYWIGALLDQAIAAAWDCGRLAAPAATGLPFEHEVGGILMQVRGRAAPQLERAGRHLAHYEQVRGEVVAKRAGRSTPLDRLARELGLSELAVDIALAAAAPQLWGELARLYGVLANDTARPLCDELLVYQLLAGRAPRGAIARELDPDQPLQRSGLVAVDGQRPFAAVRIEPTLLALLRGVDPSACAGDIVPRTATRTLAELRLAPGVLEQLVPALAVAGSKPARVALCGRLGSGRRSLAAALAATVGRQIGCIDAAVASEDPDDRAEHVRERLARCRLLGWIPCIAGLDDVAVADDTPVRRAITAAIAAHAGPVILRASAAAAVPLEPGHTRVELGVLSEGARAGAWAASLRAHGLPTAAAAELATRFRVGPGIAERAVATAGTTERIDDAVRQHLEDRLGTIATRVARLPSWADLIVPEDILDSLLELVSRVRRRRQVYEQWGYDRRITTARGVTALFQGGPGTGKTLAAGVIARELGLDMYRVDVARVMSKWIGETEKNLGAVFDAAEDGRAVLLFDEADSLFAKRTEVKSSNDRYANVEVNYLLQRLDSFEGIAILTTNLTGSIDPAFKRRLGMRLTFPFPDEDMREQIWRAHVPPEVPRTGELQLGRLAQRFQLSGGYIRNAALRAAFLAAEEGLALSHQHLERAIRLEFREIGKLSESGQLE